MQESVIERYAKNQFEQIGCKYFKFVSPGNAGVPDRIVAVPNGQTLWIEMKAPGEKPRKLQQKVLKDLVERKQRVYVIDSKEQVDSLVERLREECACD